MTDITEYGKKYIKQIQIVMTIQELDKIINRIYQDGYEDGLNKAHED